MLPSAIMAVLIIYCLKDVPGDFTGIGIRKLLAVLVVVISYHFKRSTFLSIFSWNCGVYAVAAFHLKMDPNSKNI